MVAVVGRWLGGFLVCNAGGGALMEELMYDPLWLSVFEAWSGAGDSVAPAL